MKTEARNSTAGKVTRWSLAALVVLGAALITGVADYSGAAGAMSRLFVFFLATIIVIQVIPAIMLMAAMFKGVASMVGKKSHVAAKTR